MSPAAAWALGLWLLCSALSVWNWLPTGLGPAATLRQTRRAQVGVLVGLMVLAVGGGALAASAAPVTGPWRWVAGVLAAAFAVLGGGAVTTSILGLAGDIAPTTARVQRDVLRGGTWIGALERLALLGMLMSGWPEGLAAIVAIKGLARYPELRTSTVSGSGANERFIVGTFASLGWAAVTAWALTSLLTGR